MKRVEPSLTNVSPGATPAAPSAQFSESRLADIESRFQDGLSTQQIVELFSSGERLTEATFRKYVQLGLLPRSVRVGRKGKHRGSQGRYPASVVRQIESVRALMAQGYTIQDIQREFVCLRSDIDALARQLAQVLATLDQAVSESALGTSMGTSMSSSMGAGVGDEVFGRAVGDARHSADALIEKLRAIEQRLAMRARMARAAV
jgi:DNA-binding transcriptional MerR regulator